MNFFDPLEEIRKTANYLPHWEQVGATYFITFRMADSIPANLWREMETERDAWVEIHPQPWSNEVEAEYHRRFSGQFEKWLDAGYGSCFLRRVEAREVVENALRFFDGNRYLLHIFVVMPNHVHVVVSLAESSVLEKVVHSWKSFTSHELGRRFGDEVMQPFWQEDYFDRLVRDQGHFEKCVRYVRRNPVKAGLRDGYTVYEGEVATGVE